MSITQDFAMQERGARLRKMQRFGAGRAVWAEVRAFCGENCWELNVLVIFAILLGGMLLFMSGLLHALDRIDQLERTIQVLRALRS